MESADHFRVSLFKVVGRKVAALRRKRTDTTSQAELATRVGISRAAVSALEAGQQGVSVVTLCRLALALEVEPAMLLPTTNELEGLIKEPHKQPAERLVEEFLSRHGQKANQDGGPTSAG